MSKSASGLLTAQAPSVVRAEVDVPHLYVKRVVLACDNELSMATFGVHAQDDQERDIRIERVWDIVRKGQRVSVRIRTGESGSRTIFHGWIVLAQSQAGGRMEDLEYTAMGLDWGLRVEKVFGAWCVNSDREAVWLRGIQPVFNPDGRFNRHGVDATDSDGNHRVVFTLDDDRLNPVSMHWTAADMVRYLVSCERKGDLSTAEPRLFATTYQPGGALAAFEPFDVNAEALDIWGGIVRVASLCSHGVKVRYGATRESVSLAFFTKKMDEVSVFKQMELPAATLDAVEIEDRNRVISSIDVQHDVSGIVRRMDVVAPPKLYERRWTLLQGWKLEDEEAAFGSAADVGGQVASFLRETDPETSSDWNRFKYVGRRYILNETGRDDTTTPDVGPFDFSPAFGPDDWAIRNRPFRRRLVSRDESGTPKPVQVHIAFDGGPPADIKLGNNTELLPDRAGLYFASRVPLLEALAFESGDAYDMLPISVEVDAVVEGDQSSPFDIYGLANGEEMPVPTFGLVRLDDGYRDDGQTSQDEIAQHARDLANEAIGEHYGERLVGTVTCPWVTMAFEVGDAIDRIQGRDLKVKAMVHKVCWDFIQQSTEIALQYPEIDTQGHSRQAPSETPGVSADGSQKSRDFAQLLEENSLAGSPVPDEVLADAAKMSPEKGLNWIETFGRDPGGVLLGGPSGGRDLGLDERYDEATVKEWFSDQQKKEQSRRRDEAERKRRDKERHKR